MRVFYQCYGRAHTSIVAAHLHLGNLPVETRPTVREIMSLPYFDRARETDIGQPLLLGRDRDGHEIFALGLGMGIRQGLGALCSVLRTGGEEEPLVVNTLKGLGLVARLGGGLSRELGLVAVGRPLVAHGVVKIFPRLVRTVDEVKAVLREIVS
ncbi:MAG: DUF3189 family protein [Bacteroidota bacterium]